MKEYRIAWESKLTGHKGTGSWTSRREHCEAALERVQDGELYKMMNHWIEEKEVDPCKP